jgi:hypothetical protein
MHQLTLYPTPHINKQCLKILNRLRRGPGTPFQLMQDTGVVNYTARISDLKDKGYVIECVRGKKVNTYWLRQEPGQ